MITRTLMRVARIVPSEAGNVSAAQVYIVLSVHDGEVTEASSHPRGALPGTAGMVRARLGKARR